MKKKTGTFWSEWFVTAPSFLWLALFFAIPTLIVVSFTFHGHTPNGGVAEQWSLETWRALVDPDYPTIIWRTLRISFKVTLWCILLALPCAYAIARLDKKWRAAVAGTIMLPFWTSFVVRVFAWRTMLHPNGLLQEWYCAFCQFGDRVFHSMPAFLQNTLVTLGLATPGVFDPTNATILDSEMAVVLVSVYSFLPFAIMPIYSAAEKFDFSLIEAARDLGANSFYAFRKIFIPCIRQGIVSAVLMVFIPAIGSYVIPQMLGGTNCVLIGNKIFMRAIQNRNIPHASALATVMAVSVMLPLALTVWWQSRQKAREQKRLAEEKAATSRTMEAAS
ncbi:MAG: ABC transporter permease [Kiritimatiellae bacterium]|nr:ABC transporter permease [Kiritimatiellia bacterium]